MPTAILRLFVLAVLLVAGSVNLSVSDHPFRPPLMISLPALGYDVSVFIFSSLETLFILHLLKVQRTYK